MKISFITILLLIITINSYTIQSFIDNLSLMNSKFIDLDNIIIDNQNEKYKFTITNIYFLQPLCKKSLSEIIEGNDTHTKTNCLMTAIMNIIINPKQFQSSSAFSFNLPEFILEYNYNAITFSISPINRQLNTQFNYDSTSIHYNTNLPLFTSSFAKDLTLIFTTTLPIELSNLYITKFNEQLIDITISYPSLVTLFNLVGLTGNRILHYESLDTKAFKRLTYIEFTLPELVKYLKVDKKDVPERIRVNFDYSVNYDLNYKNGSFIMEDIEIKNEKILWRQDLNGFMPSEEDKEIKESLMMEFSNVLNDCLRRYYNGNEMVNKNEAKEDE